MLAIPGDQQSQLIPCIKWIRDLLSFFDLLRPYDRMHLTWPSFYASIRYGISVQTRQISILSYLQTHLIIYTRFTVLKLFRDSKIIVKQTTSLYQAQNKAAM